MQYLLSTARNHTITVRAEPNQEITETSKITSEPCIEMVLVTYETKHELVSGTLIPIKTTQTTRIGLTINSAKELATEIQEWAIEAEIIKQKIGEIKCSQEN